ncbi:MAG: glycosyltransferase, partial [Myxococcota bacterium]
MTVTWLSPGAPDQRTGGYLWNARIAAELRASGTEVEVIAVDGRWPMPGVADPAPLAAIPDGAVVVADGLLWPGLGAAGAALAARCRVVVVVHSLLARENGPAARPLGGAAPAGIDAIERRSWTGVKALIATSDATAAEIAADTVSSAAIPVTVVVPGTAPAPRATGGDGRTVLVVGTLTRRKGHDRVLDALAAVTAPWTLVCAGGPRDPAWAAELRAHADRLGIGPRVRWTGELDDAGVDLSLIH